jgi:precorrin-2 dehydrogenase/sirohydrochlorin ferrochelatase
VETYPICLIKLQNCLALVVGGGSVALRKVRGLLAAGAQVTVISLNLHTDLRALSHSGEVKVIERAYQPGDLAGAFLVVAATDDTQTNISVWQEAQQCGCLVNVVDDPGHSNFILPAVVRRGEMTISISTGGNSPALARRLREQLETLFGPEYGDLVALMGDLRPDLLERFPPGKPRLEAALQLVDSDILEVIRQDGVEVARTYAEHILQQTAVEKGYSETGADRLVSAAEGPHVVQEQGG